MDSMSRLDNDLERTSPSAQIARGASALIQDALDPSVVGIAVELTLSKTHLNAETVEPCLASLCNLLMVDCVFVALFDDACEKIEWVNSVSNQYEQCNPFLLLSSAQPCNERLQTKLVSKQLLEIRDTGATDNEAVEFSHHLASLNLSSMLVAGLCCNQRLAGIIVLGTVQRRSRWNMNTHLVLKLVSASYAAGHHRHLLNATYMQRADDCMNNDDEFVLNDCEE